MKKRIISVITILAVFGGIALTSVRPQVIYGAEEKTADYVENKVLVVFNDDINNKESKEVVEDLGGEKTEILDTIDSQIVGAVTLPQDQSVEEAVKAYTKDPDVKYAQPNYMYKLEGQNTDKTAKTATTDKDYGKQWYLNKVEAEGAWDILDKIETEKVKVAVLDTGVDVNHVDLQDNLNKDLSVDITQKKGGQYPKLLKDLDEHGTHVAGIIGATANNNIGVAGVGTGKNNNLIDLLAVNVFTYIKNISEPGLYALTEDIIKAIAYAENHGVKVINLSLATYDYDKAFNDEIEKGTKAGITIVCAASNEGTAQPAYPASYKDTISVIATNKDDKKADFSNFGDTTDLSAPGKDIYSTVVGNKYAYNSGTSMAAPVVSAVAAMIYAAKPSIEPSQVKDVLKKTAKDLYTPGKDIYSGWGLVNGKRAIRYAMDPYTFPVTGVKMSKTSATLSKGKTLLLSATVMPYWTANKNLRWISSNTKVATVSSTGKVTGKKNGIATVTAVSKENANKKATCTITVPYNIKYKLNSGQNNNSNPSSYYNKKVALKDPSKGKYNFSGWYTDSKYKNKISSIDKVANKDYTLYAKWNKVSVGKGSVYWLDKTGKTKLKVLCKGVRGASGYEIVYSRYPNFPSSATKKIITKNKVKTLTGLKSWKRYYVKIRAYEMDSKGHKIYGPYSKVTYR
ncbi:MAG: S8 family serine peptidase [Anaerovoracaceae bacterium]